MNVNAKQMVHHGVECMAFVAIGTVAGSSFSAACAAYGAGKITYLGARMLLDTAAPGLSKQTQRSISWAASLLIGGSILHTALAKAGKQSVSGLATAAIVTGTTVASLGVRALADKGFKYLTATGIKK